SNVPALYLVAPTGEVTLVVSGRRDVQPFGQPLYGPAGRLFFLAQNLDLPPVRTGGAPVGLYRVRPGGLEGVAVPRQPVPARSGVSLLSVTQRPVVNARDLAFGILFG